ncbi:MAG: hypothetical protein OEV93_00355 [Candidatus Moranbacteria bacterium]|nr:hypothetical protein [Candidatus Moranbacteria bacterium]
MWKLGSDELVSNRHHSHLHDDVAEILTEALSRIDSGKRDFFVEQVDFGRVVGETICVATDNGDEIVFAKRPKRYGHTRFVKTKRPEPCSSLVVILKKIETGYVLISAFVGVKPQPEPWDHRSFSQQSDPQKAERLAIEFWNSHALVWGCDVISGTETTRCPW